jgi:hypothetical protein
MDDDMTKALRHLEASIALAISKVTGMRNAGAEANDMAVMVGLGVIYGLSDAAQIMEALQTGQEPPTPEGRCVQSLAMVAKVLPITRPAYDKSKH